MPRNAVMVPGLQRTGDDMDHPSGLLRVYHFLCDGMPCSIAVPHSVSVAPSEHEMHLAAQFHALLEAIFPGRRSEGRIGRVVWSDVLPRESAVEPARSARRRRTSASASASAAAAALVG